MCRATFQSEIDDPWTGLEPIRLGHVPPGRGTPDRYLTVEADRGHLLRVDLYRSTDECFPFEEALSWSGWLVIGWGHHLFLVNLQSHATSTVDLGTYFRHLYPAIDYLLVASGERLLRVDPDGEVRWQSGALGIDGVIVDAVADGVISGRGEWDPPGGWRPFKVRLDTGETG